MAYLTGVFVCCYAVYMLLMRKAWQRAGLSELEPNERVSPGVMITVLIPYRNEQETLPKLLTDILGAEYKSGLLKIVLVNDHSEDNTPQLLNRQISGLDHVTHIENEGKGKAGALNSGLKHAQGDYIITMDADIRLNDGWYARLQEALSKTPDLLILPVHGLSGKSLASKYAQLDFMSLVGITFAMAELNRPIMCNAALLGVRRSLAHWSENIISGDDVFLLHDIKAKGGRVDYVLDSKLVARTSMPKTWSAVLNQRVRWASKSMNYRDKDTMIVAWGIVAFNALLWVLLIAAIFSPYALWLFLTMFISKALLDLFFLFPVLSWFGTLKSLVIYPIAMLLNVIQYPLVLLSSRWGGFEWKERSYKR